VPLYADFPELEAEERPASVRRSSHSAPPTLVFSDLARWMLKLLLAADIKRAAAEEWRGLKRAREGERPDLILKQHPYPQSLLRGRVMRDGVWVSDIIQTWLDVSADPTRGAEQAAELEHGVLAKVVGEKM